MSRSSKLINVAVFIVNVVTWLTSEWPIIIGIKVNPLIPTITPSEVNGRLLHKVCLLAYNHDKDNCIRLFSHQCLSLSSNIYCNIVDSLKHHSIDNPEIHIIIANHLYCLRRQRSSETSLLTPIYDYSNLMDQVSIIYNQTFYSKIKILQWTLKCRLLHLIIA